MAEMNTKELTTYLKYAAELESSVFRQEKAISQANKDLVLKKPMKKRISKPVNKAKTMTKPSAPVMEKGKFGKGMIVWGILQGLLGISCLPISAVGIGLANLAMGGLIAFGGIKLKQFVNKNNAKRQQEYNDAVKAYEEGVKQAEKTYQENMVAYHAETAAAKEAYDKEYAIAKRQFNHAKDAVSQMDMPLWETKQALKKLYSADIIFPKYRDMVAMCTMYEYFVTGRCTELTGPNGAYNLYEAELRQNLIINRLDTIITQLEEIKQNQYTLYQEMRTTNRILSDISSDVKGILSSTREIATASKITAHCAQVTAQNTEALKYITLVNG